MGGLAAAIVRVGGMEIQKESDQIVQKSGLIKTGEVAVTAAGKI